MAFDQFKTQVLLLHSEQSTLDSLSSGFGDRYTVHCATSGSEALNTLVETPINVIITAQDLPGMSGLEALREARKRSPDMLGFILAGNGDAGLEALVGDEEVFQVVRGSVTGDSLLKLVDNATRQMRLMALAESANDTAARPDEPAEHIIMETSENGSTIISDGTGQVPALNPAKVSAAAAIGAQSVDVLVLTKDQEFLTTIKESSRGMHTVHYANTLAQADELIREHKVGVAVVDAAMVGPKVEQLTQHLRKGSARLVSIVAGRRDDGEMLMDLINRGKVYRFLLKPVSPGRARLAVEASVKHHLEAPDVAFKMSGATAARPAAAPKPAAKSAPASKPRTRQAPAAKQAAAPTADAKPAPQAARGPAPAAKPKPAPSPDPVDPPLGDPSVASPIDDGLSSAFGDDDSSFAETVTGLISSVGKKFKNTEEVSPPQADGTVMELPTPSTASSSGGSILSNPKLIGLAAIAVIAALGTTFWFMRGDDAAVPVTEPVTTTLSPSITETDGEFGEATAGDAVVEALIAEARLAREAGQIFNPAGSNAIELYAAAVAADPSNSISAAELDATVQQAIGMAETALLESRIDDAEAALQRVEMVDANNSRLPFLTAQLWQMQLRNHLDNARAAIRDKRFEDAGNAVAAASALNPADTTEIDAVRDELSVARSAQKVDEVLAMANARLEEGSLLSPVNDNARYFYDLVLANDPANTAAQQGLSIVASRLVLQARAEIDAGNLDVAAAILDDASVIDAANAELAGATAALLNARDAVAQRAAQERLRIEEANRQAAADEAAAQRRQAEEAAAAQAAADLAASQQAAAELASAEQTTEQTDAGDPAGATASAADVVTTAMEDPVATAAMPVADSVQQQELQPELQPEPEPEPTVPVATRDQTPVSISALNRTRYVAPKYPRTAQRRSVSGWVDVTFTVAMDGSVKDVEVLKAEPEGVFDNSAMRAVEKWEFEPVIENGVLVEKRAGVRMSFALE